MTAKEYYKEYYNGFHKPNSHETFEDVIVRIMEDYHQHKLKEEIKLDTEPSYNFNNNLYQNQVPYNFNNRGTNPEPILFTPKE